MNRRCFPSKSWLAECIGGILLVLALVYELTNCISMMIPDCDNDILLTLYTVITIMVFALGGLFFLFATHFTFCMAGRPICIEPDIITQGWYLKESCTKDDVTGFGIASLNKRPDKPPENEKGKARAEYEQRELGIYLVCGNFGKDNLRRFGIGAICYLSFLNRYSQKLLNLVFDLAAIFGDNLDDAVIPEKMFWLKYSDENYRMLASWLGQERCEMLSTVHDVFA